MEKDVVLISFTKDEFKEIVRSAILEAQEPSIDVNEKPISQREAAEDVLGCSLPTLIKLKRENKIPYEQAPGSRKVRFYKSQLRNALQQNPHLLRRKS